MNEDFIRLTDQFGEPFYVQAKTIANVINGPNGLTRINMKQPNVPGLLCIESTTEVYEKINEKVSA